MKNPDFLAAYGCSDCHAEADRRTHQIDIMLAREYFYEGIFRTQKIFLKEGLITIKGEKCK